MAINFVAAGAAEADSISLSAHQEHDIILIVAYSTGTTAIEFPAGYDQVSLNNTGVLRRSVIATKRAASSAETSGTFTNATHIMYYIARPADKHLFVANNSSANTNNSTSQVNPSLSCRKQSRIVRMAAFDPSSATGFSAQTGFTSRVASVLTNAACHVSDSDAMELSVGIYTNTMSVAVRSHSYAIEIAETTIDIASGGAAFQLVGGGGLVY
jgi:hypothetical protein